MAQTQAKLEHFTFSVKPNLNIQYSTKFNLFTTYELQQTWPLATKSSEEKQFSHQIATFSKEIKKSPLNIKKYIKMVTKSYFVTEDITTGDDHYRPSKKLAKWDLGRQKHSSPDINNR